MSIITGSKNNCEILSKQLNIETASELAEIRMTCSDAQEKADIIADFIISEYENKVLFKIINQNYFYFQDSARKKIFEQALDYKRIHSENILEKILYKKRMKIISEKIKEYILSDDKLIIDGFVNFRLGEYKQELEEIIDKAVEKYMLEKEYNEFIKLLKYFIEIQPPKEELVHIVLTNEDHLLYDRRKKEITDKYAKDFAAAKSENIINHDDMLISSLIMLAPKAIILHNQKEVGKEELCTTIKKVFENKVKSCEGCAFCRPV